MPGPVGYGASQSPYYAPESDYMSSIKGEEAKGDALQLEKMQKLNKATEQNTSVAYLQKLQ